MSAIKPNAGEAALGTPFPTGSNLPLRTAPEPSNTEREHGTRVALRALAGGGGLKHFAVAP
eukprot:7978226-Lingulodinium_polyedra.AAC.1